MRHTEDSCWFVLPDGSTATEIEVTVPVKGRVKATAEMVADYDAVRDTIYEHEAKIRVHHSGSLQTRLRAAMDRYESIACDAIEQAKSARDDMIAYLRGINFVLETCLAAHTHAEKAARLRGVVEVIEGRIGALREVEFKLGESYWQRHRDIMRWDAPERRLRDRISELEAELREHRNADAT